MKKKKLSSSELGKKKRDERIVRIFDAKLSLFAERCDLYKYIAARVGCSEATVFRTLRRNDRIATRKQEAWQ